MAFERFKSSGSQSLSRHLGSLLGRDPLDERQVTVDDGLSLAGYASAVTRCQSRSTDPYLPSRSTLSPCCVRSGRTVSKSILSPHEQENRKSISEKKTNA